MLIPKLKILVLSQQLWIKIKGLFWSLHPELHKHRWLLPWKLAHNISQDNVRCWFQNWKLKCTTSSNSPDFCHQSDYLYLVTNGINRWTWRLVSGQIVLQKPESSSDLLSLPPVVTEKCTFPKAFDLLSWWSLCASNGRLSVTRFINTSGWNTHRTKVLNAVKIVRSCWEHLSLNLILLKKSIIQSVK